MARSGRWLIDAACSTLLGDRLGSDLPAGESGAAVEVIGECRRGQAQDRCAWHRSSWSASYPQAPQIGKLTRRGWRMFARTHRLLPIGALVAVLVAVVSAGTPANAALSVLVMPDPVLVGTLSFVQGPIITEQSSGDIGRGKVTFRLSAGFAWFPGAEIPNVSVVDAGRCKGWNTLRLGPDKVQSTSVFPYGRDLTVVIGRSSRRGCRGELRFTGFQVHARHTGTGTVTN